MSGNGDIVSWIQMARNNYVKICRMYLALTKINNKVFTVFLSSHSTVLLPNLVIKWNGHDKEIFSEDFDWAYSRIVQREECILLYLVISGSNSANNPATHCRERNKQSRNIYDYENLWRVGGTMKEFFDNTSILVL